MTGNTIHGAIRKKPHLFWSLAGFIATTANMAWGSYALTYADFDDLRAGDPFLNIGIAHIAFGGLNLGAAIWAMAVGRPAEAQRISLAPIVVVDSTAVASPGLGVRMTAF